METKTIARIGAAAFVGVVITMTALQMRDAPAQPTETEIIALDEEGVDPLPGELRRCQAIGAAGANDAMCLRAWAENRSRFFMSDVQANGQLADDAAIIPLGNDSDTVDDNKDAVAELPVAPPLAGNR
jgi:conjugative transfer region protein TrbK